MKVHVIWYGGPDYSKMDDNKSDYMEEFPSVMSASIQLYNRVHINDVPLLFSFIYVDPEYIYIGSVEGSYMELYQPGKNKPFAKMYLDEKGKPVYRTIKD